MKSMFLLLFIEITAFALLSFLWIRAFQFLVTPGGALFIMSKKIRNWFKYYIDTNEETDIYGWKYLLLKPSLFCDVCMSSVHGSYLFFAMILAKYFVVLEIWHWPLACMLTAGITIAYNEMNN